MRKLFFLIGILLILVVITAIRAKNMPVATAPINTEKPIITTTEILPIPTTPVTTKPVAKHNPNVFFPYLVKLPVAEGVKDTNQDGFHHRPQAVVDAAEVMGEIAEKLEKEPALIPQGIKFYESCAKKGTLLISVRALCLRNLMDYLKNPNLDTSDYSADLVRIANKIPAR